MISAGTKLLIQRAAEELKAAGAREVYVFGSVAKGTSDLGSDLDLAVSGLPPAVFYRLGARLRACFKNPIKSYFNDIVQGFRFV